MLVAKRKVTVGTRAYWPGQTITSEDEAILRSRPRFSLLLEEGRIVEVDDAPPFPTVAGVTAPDPEPVAASSEEHTCELCGFQSKSAHGLKIHKRMAHPD